MNPNPKFMHSFDCPVRRDAKVDQQACECGYVARLNGYTSSDVSHEVERCPKTRDFFDDQPTSILNSKTL